MNDLTYADLYPYSEVELENREATEELNHLNDEQNYE